MVTRYWLGVGLVVGEDGAVSLLPQMTMKSGRREELSGVIADLLKAWTGVPPEHS